MKITFKLYATLQHLLPSEAVENAVQIEVDDNVSLYQVIDKFSVPREKAHLVLVNGTYVDEAGRDLPGSLSNGDVIAVWPPVAGG